MGWAGPVVALSGFLEKRAISLPHELNETEKDIYTAVRNGSSKCVRQPAREDARVV